MADEASARQSLASDPAASVWVTASAGSGKTKVLTDRVLRLLLSGTPPSKILCITYTKAGAAEMRSRIEKRLGRWVMMNDDKLREEVGQLTGKNEPFLEKSLETARQLFARVIEDPVGLRIQTIHSFCQSLLARFPIEAGLVPNFTLLDDVSSTRLLAEAKHRLAGGGMAEDVPELNRAIKKIARTSGEWGFDDLLSALISRRKDFFAVPDGEIREVDLQRVQKAIFTACGVPENIINEEKLAEHCWLTPEEEEKLHALSHLLATGNKTVVERAEIMRAYFKKEQQALDTIYHIRDAFFNNKDQPYANWDVKLSVRHPEMGAHIDCLTQRIQSIQMLIRSFETAERAYASYVIAAYLYATYQQLKEKQAALDYDDLIFKAQQLLAGDRALAWVMFKLDGGIDHVLVDEAQDTSRAQWDITAALVDEFFAGQGRGEGNTLFVVGDPKQSIFRFQGAFPEGFTERFQYFKERAAAARIDFRHVPLTTSFRSSPAILNFADAVFSGDAARAGLGEYLPHIAHYSAFAGRIEVWPLQESDQKEKKSAWELPKITPGMRTGTNKLAGEIAETIYQWLKEKRVLPATGEVIEPRDIMILSRRREPMASALIQAFQEKAIPCTGLDRLALTEHIAVKDMLALGSFLLMSGDDLSLACVLKSPLYGLSEDTLLTLCANRGRETLWSQVKQYAGNDDNVLAVQRELDLLLGKTDYISPYDLFAKVLYELGGMRRMCARLGEHVSEVLEMFLAEALAYEENTTPSLEEFCHTMTLNKREVKRDQEEIGNEVRILTVHGAKGLEAPIVFLVDTTSTSGIRGDDRLASLEGIPIPLPSKRESSALTAALRAEQEKQIEEEYRRLLYVALTRAKHELYITGVKPGGNRQLSPQSWYALANRGLDAIGVGNIEGQKRVFDETGTVLTKERVEIPALPVPPAPEYLLAKAKPEALQTIRNPSHLDEVVEEVTQNRFFSAEDRQKRIERGIVIHRLLEVLAQVDPAQQLNVGKKLVAAHAPHVSVAEREAWIENTVRLMQHPDFSTVFGKDSMSEVPIAGPMEDGTLISGQIDRLVVTDTDVHVIDFKSGIWKKGSAIPLKYKNQMRAYSSVLRQIFPGKTIRSGLLFTEGPEMVWVNEDS
ncbi:MAG: double-strand break repair helicase AddA [Rickettsiales bacterium]